MNTFVQQKPSGKKEKKFTQEQRRLIAPVRTKLLEWSGRQDFILITTTSATFPHPSIIREWGINE